MAIAPISPPPGLAQSLTANALQTAQSAIANALNNQIEVGRQATSAFLQQERDFYTERARRLADERADSALKLRESESDRNFIRALDRDRSADAFRERTVGIAENQDARNEQTFNRNLETQQELDAAGLGPVDTAQFNRDIAKTNQELAKNRNELAIQKEERMAEAEDLQLAAALDQKRAQGEFDSAAEQTLAILGERDVSNLSVGDLSAASATLARSKSPEAVATKARVDALLEQRSETSPTNTDVKKQIESAQASLYRADEEITKETERLANLDPEDESNEKTIALAKANIAQAEQRKLLYAEKIRALKGEPEAAPIDPNDLNDELFNEILYGQ